MKKTKRTLVMLVMILAMVLAGCGGKEVVMKEFTSEDGSVSVQMDESWAIEDMGAGTESWIAAFTSDGAEGIIVMQMPKNTIGLAVSDMAGWKSIIESSYPMSGMEKVDSPSIIGMDIEGAYSCTVTAEGVKGAGRVLYGETDYAYYCILYAAPKINDKKAEYFNNVCTSFKETAPEIENASTVEKTDTIQWFNNTCAVLTAVNGWDYTMFGGLPANDDSKAVAQTLLSEGWEVTDRGTADETMDWLLTEGHRVSYVDDMEYIKETGVADVAAGDRMNFFLQNFDVSEEEAQDYIDWYGFYEQYGEDAIAAWDYGRAMSLLGYYYLAGYYTEEEALNKSLEVANTIQSTFDSWDSFMESYFVGYEYWAGDSSDERRGIYGDIKAASDSPYSIDWNITFEKNW